MTKVEKSKARSLLEWPLRQQAIVDTIEGPEDLKRRFFELGLTPGTPVMVMQKAPLQSGLSILCRGTILGIRQETAHRIFVKEPS